MAAASQQEYNSEVRRGLSIRSRIAKRRPETKAGSGVVEEENSVGEGLEMDLEGFGAGGGAKWAGEIFSVALSGEEGMEEG